MLDAAGKLRAELFGASIESMTAVALGLLANASGSAVVQEVLVARVQVTIELRFRRRGARLAAAHVRERRVLEKPPERRALLGRRARRAAAREISRARP